MSLLRSSTVRPLCSRSQNIKQATELSALGEQLSETELEVAHELHACRIPASWRQLCGEQLAPPPSFPLSSFLGDLYARSQHLDKMLTLVRRARGFLVVFPVARIYTLQYL